MSSLGDPAVLPDGGAWSAWLDDAERIGLVTPAGRDLALPHSLAMAEALVRALPSLSSRQDPGGDRSSSEGTLPAGPRKRVVDLGSGAGLPGLVIAAVLPETEVILVEASIRRAEFLASWSRELGLGERVKVWNGRAETLGRDPAHRGRAMAVSARGFGQPAVVAECAAPLLSIGGVLVVSDPPAAVDAGDLDPLPWDEARWPSDSLSGLGLEALARQSTPFSLSVIAKVRTTPDRYPRRVGVPAKRPLFGTAPPDSR